MLKKFFFENRLLIIALINNILESLAISSSSHIKFIKKYIFNHYYNLNEEDENAIIHILSIITISIFLYTQKLLIFKHILSYQHFLLNIFIVDLITYISYIFIKKKLYKHYNQGNFITYGLLITFLSLLSLFFLDTNNIKYYNLDLKFKYIIILSIAQSIAILPGISRLALTYTTIRWIGLNHQLSLLLSLIIELPLLIGALSIYIIKNLKYYKKVLIFKLNFLQILLTTFSIIFSYSILYLTINNNKFINYTIFYIPFAILISLKRGNK